VATYSVRSSANLIGLVWFGAPSLSGVAELEQTFEKVIKAHPGKRVAFASRITQEAVSAGAPPEIRQRIGDLLKRFGPRIAATVIIFEGTGVRATVVRTIIATINLLSRSQFPSEVHSNLLRGCMWLISQLGEESPTDGERRLMEILPARDPGTVTSTHPISKAR
jgi:hypothetical protein